MELFLVSTAIRPLSLVALIPPLPFALVLHPPPPQSHMLFSGRADDTGPFLDAVGLPVPAGWNTADWLLELSATQPAHADNRTPRPDGGFVLGMIV